MPKCENCKKYIVTNADRIRSMTDEELANLLSSAWNKADYEDGDYDPAWLDLLKKPYGGEVEHGSAMLANLYCRTPARACQ